MEILNDLEVNVPHLSEPLPVADITSQPQIQLFPDELCVPRNPSGCVMKLALAKSPHQTDGVRLSTNSSAAD